MKKNLGFTLIELMIVVAVIAILSAIALPSYDEYIKRGRRADAKAALRQAATWIEKAQTATGLYPTVAQFNATGLTVKGAYTIILTVMPGAPAVATAYTLTATPTAASVQVGDKCGDFVLDETGVMSVVNAVAPMDSAQCWNR